ncbi:MAG: signal recognition particle protein, partial [Bacteroidota bacterium]
LEVFHPDRVARRILGMADVVSLVERAEKVFSEEEARKISKKLHRQQFDFNDLKKQIDQLKNMGTIQSIMKLIPEMNHAEIDDRQFDSWRVVIDSMTPYERENPDVLRNYKRQVRIAGGSGTSLTILKKMLKKFEEMRKKAKHIRKGGFYD